MGMVQRKAPAAVRAPVGRACLFFPVGAVQDATPHGGRPASRRNALLLRTDVENTRTRRAGSLGPRSRDRRALCAGASTSLGSPLDLPCDICPTACLPNHRRRSEGGVGSRDGPSPKSLPPMLMVIVGSVWALEQSAVTLPMLAGILFIAAGGPARIEVPVSTTM